MLFRCEPAVPFILSPHHRAKHSGVIQALRRFIKTSYLTHVRAITFRKENHYFRLSKTGRMMTSAGTSLVRLSKTLFTSSSCAFPQSAPKANMLLRSHFTLSILYSAASSSSFVILISFPRAGVDPWSESHLSDASTCGTWRAKIHRFLSNSLQNNNDVHGIPKSTPM